MSSWKSVLDSALERLVPHAYASAGCAPEYRTEYRCNSNTRERQKRTCKLELNCQWNCGPWTYTGQSC